MKENKRYAEIKDMHFIVDEVKSHAIHITMSSDPIDFDFTSNKINLKVNTVNIQNHKSTLIKPKLIKRKLITQIINKMTFKSVFSK